MVRKLFALASVTALTGLVASITAAGCSSTEVIGGASGGLASDAGKRDAVAPPQTEESTASCKAAGAFTKETINPPAARQKACTAPQITAITTACATGVDADPNGTECAAARAKEADKTCAECIFGSDADANWKVVNLNPNAATRKVRFNQAGCIEYATNVKGCGDQLLTLNICLSQFCGGAECTTRDDQDACIDEVFPDGECGDYGLTSACNSAAFTGSTSDAVDACFAQDTDTDDARLFAYMATLACGGSSITDGGSDGDADAN